MRGIGSFLFSVSEQHVMLELAGLQDVLGSRPAGWAHTFSKQKFFF